MNCVISWCCKHGHAINQPQDIVLTSFSRDSPCRFPSTLTTPNPTMMCGHGVTDNRPQSVQARRSKGRTMVDMADVLVALEMQRMQQQAAMLAATPPGSRSSFGSLSSWASSSSLAARASLDAGLPPPPPYEFQHRKVCMCTCDFFYYPQIIHPLVSMLECTIQLSLCSCLVAVLWREPRRERIVLPAGWH